MKSIFNKEEQEELIKRIKLLDENKTALWGSMNVFQMLLHCTYWDNWMQGNNQQRYKQNFIGRIFGKMGLKRMVKDNSPLDKNVPTGKAFKIKQTYCDLEVEKAQWIKLINQYQQYNNPDFIHVFFGKMSTESIGILAYKHTDHHLRQFGV